LALDLTSQVIALSFNAYFPTLTATYACVFQNDQFVFVCPSMGFDCVSRVFWG
ncbi:hypothetical protein K435DRAFT_897626, partial [Dendrothele bispora CBS 962.96]